MAESAEFGIAVLAALTVLLFPDGLSIWIRDYDRGRGPRENLR